MAKDYFNLLETKKILELKESDPERALQMYAAYFEKYPYDYSTYCYYIDQFLILGRIKEAEDAINKVYAMIDADEAYKTGHKEKRRIFRKNISYAKLRLLLLKREYKKALNFERNHTEELSESNIGAIDIFCMKNLGTLDMSRESNSSYIFKQMIEYKEDEAIDHIKRHHGENDETKDGEGFFMTSFPLEEVLLEVKKYIPSDKAMYPGFGDETYYFKYDNCGRNNRRVNNYFKVVCINGTSDIITMYPINFGEHVPHIDLNYMIPKEKYEDANGPVRNSRIDRFNKRWGK